MKTRKIFQEVYELLHRHFGYRNWWPVLGEGEKTLYLPEFRQRERTPEEMEEIIIGAILTQNTAWSNVEKALVELRRHSALSFTVLQETPEEVIAQWVRPSGYFNQKAKKIKAFIATVERDLEGNGAKLKQKPAHEARQLLLSIWGIGRETADSILLYAYYFPFFVVDAYTRRIFSRLGQVNFDDDYDTIREIFEANLERDHYLYNEYHALIVELGKNICRKNPLCGECPLSTACIFPSN